MCGVALCSEGMDSRGGPHRFKRWPPPYGVALCSVWHLVPFRITGACQVLTYQVNTWHDDRVVAEHNQAELSKLEYRQQTVFNTGAPDEVTGTTRLKCERKIRQQLA